MADVRDPPQELGQSPLLHVTDYAHNIACSNAVTAVLGERIALIIDDAAGIAMDAAPAQHFRDVVRDIEAMLRLFDSCVGKQPVLQNPYRGLIRYEVAFLNNAAGLAGHGVAGIAFGPAFLQDMLRARLEGHHLLPHVLWYETMRNYIFPEEFTNVFDYRLTHAHNGADPRGCWGWVNQGFVNVTGCLLSRQLTGIEFDYFGHSRDWFCASMESQLDRYAQSTMPWESCFMHERLPWDESSSLDNVYSGILCAMYRQFGGVAFLRRFFAAIPLLMQRRPSSKDDFVGARDNFYLAACCAAGSDAAVAEVYMKSTLRWPTSAQLEDGCVLEALLAVMEQQQQQ